MNTFHSMHEYRGSERMECEDRSAAGNGMCYLGEMLEGGGGLRSCFPPNLCTAEQFQYRAIRPVSRKSRVAVVGAGGNCGGERKIGWVSDRHGKS